MTERTSSFADTLGLNDVQRAAVVHDGGPQLVFAGAGTGKTKVLTARIAWLIREKNVFPAQIFAATFTNKAAREMRDRVAKLTNLDCRALWIGTFHSLCCRILRMEARHLGYVSSFTIYDTDDQSSLIKAILKERGIDEKTMQARSVLHAISSFKNACKPFSEVDGTGKSFADREIIAIYGAYQAALKRCNAMDFDDLICNTVYLLRGNEQVREEWQRRFGWVLVDEYQDTNVAQFLLVKLLSGTHGRIFVVGDDDQSIYAWRGAKIENILKFAEQFEGTRIFKLEQNYRSTTPILDLANCVIERNSVRAEKKLWTAKAEGREVVLSSFRDDRHEAEKTVAKIMRFVAEGSPAGEIAILYRTNAQSRSFEDALRKKNVPYVLVGGLSFYERKEIKDCLAYLRIVANPRDDVSCQRILNVPARGIGDKTQERISATARSQDLSLAEYIAADGMEGASGTAKKGLVELAKLLRECAEMNEAGIAPKDILSEILTNTGYVTLLEDDDTEESRGRVENINELLNALEEYAEDNPEGTLLGFLEQVTLVADIDKWEQGEAVNLITLHSAKGLEFRHVFLTGVEEGILPSRQNFDDAERIEEERRLLYVGITRAMISLDASYCQQRLRFGSWTIMGPSRFLSDVPTDKYRFVDECALFEMPPEPQQRGSSQYGGKTGGYGSAGGYGAASGQRGSASQFGNKSSATNPYLNRGASSAPAAPAWKTAARDAAIRPNRPVLEAPQFDEVSQIEVTMRQGQPVRHAEFGSGKIVHVSGFGADTRIEILFEGGVRKKMMAKFAKLEML